MGRMISRTEQRTAMGNDFSPQCNEVMNLLKNARNVLISGPPGTGKSRLLAEIGRAFIGEFPDKNVQTHAIHRLDGPVPIPAHAGAVRDGRSTYLAPESEGRKVFRTVFHQGSRHREFLTGLTPTVGPDSSQGFAVTQGILYRASEHAKRRNSASLLIIDEINRGPAVQVFGGAIVGLEAEKRLATDNSAMDETHFFELVDPATGEMVEYALPNQLYIIAAMNQADASVEPLDVAFLRRWEPFRLEPSVEILRDYYGLGQVSAPLPVTPSNATDMHEASVQAWEAVNRQIRLGRGADYQLGHGILMAGRPEKEIPLAAATSSTCIGWAKIRAHIEEVFFGDLRGVAAALNALDGPEFHPFRLVGELFADDIKYRIDGPTKFDSLNIYPTLRAIAMRQN